VTECVHIVGDVMYDAILGALEGSNVPTFQRSNVLDRLGLRSGEYLLVTVHRASNTDNLDNLRSIVSALSEAGERVVFPAHPRTRKAMEAAGIEPGDNVQTVEPVSYMEMLALEKHARKILTDSGGVQKEALWLGVPCITMRTE